MALRLHLSHPAHSLVNVVGSLSILCQINSSCPKGFGGLEQPGRGRGYCFRVHHPVNTVHARPCTTRPAFMCAKALPCGLTCCAHVPFATHQAQNVERFCWGHRGGRGFVVSVCCHGPCFKRAILQGPHAAIFFSKTACASWFCGTPCRKNKTGSCSILQREAHALSCKSHAPIFFFENRVRLLVLRHAVPQK